MKQFFSERRAGKDLLLLFLCSSRQLCLMLRGIHWMSFISNFNFFHHNYSTGCLYIALIVRKQTFADFHQNILFWLWQIALPLPNIYEYDKFIARHHNPYQPLFFVSTFSELFQSLPIVFLWCSSSLNVFLANRWPELFTVSCC